MIMSTAFEPRRDLAQALTLFFYAEDLFGEAQGELVLGPGQAENRSKVENLRAKIELSFQKQCL